MILSDAWISCDDTVPEQKWMCLNLSFEDKYGNEMGTYSIQFYTGVPLECVREELISKLKGMK